MYSERLTPKFSVLAAAALIGGVLGLLGLPFSLTATLVAIIVMALLVPGILWALSPVIKITQSGDGPSGIELKCGRAHIDVAHLGEAQILDAEALHNRLGLESSGRDFVCYSPWVKTGVAIDNRDEADPITTWVVCSRTPGRLIDSLTKHTPSR